MMLLPTPSALSFGVDPMVPGVVGFTGTLPPDTVFFGVPIIPDDAIRVIAVPPDPTSLIVAPLRGRLAATRGLAGLVPDPDPTIAQNAAHGALSPIGVGAIVAAGAGDIGVTGSKTIKAGTGRTIKPRRGKTLKPKAGATLKGSD